MKKPLRAALSLALAVSAHAQSQDAKPVWELGKNPIDPASIQGKVELVDGTVKLDGQNSFAIPASVLGAQNDYTIECELKRAPDAKGGISVFSNADAQNKTGIECGYSPPAYNTLGISINGHPTIEKGGFLDENFTKVTLVVKDRKLALFRNGLILAMTSEVAPSSLPLTFGKVMKAPTTPYELRNIRIYDTAFFPTGFDKSAEMMRNFSGDEYMLQRVDITNPALPRILVIGDSISMGYRGFITEHFKSRAYVDYWVPNVMFRLKPSDVRGDDAPLKRAWRGVLSNGPYDVVSWNATTLHQWDPPDRAPEDSYVSNMTEIVSWLKKIAPDTRFIWIRSTPVRTTPKEGRPTLINEINERNIRFNKMTDEIMAKYGIPEVDLYGLCETKLDTVPAGSQDSAHWNKDVSREMADLIIKEIEKNLSEKQKQGARK
ncbi:MAG: SGNH/GDSL hydrolase family protein [Terrimicrobiaceae bacterium]